VGPTGQIFKHYPTVSFSVFLLNKKTETLKINNSLKNGQKNMKPILLA